MMFLRYRYRQGRFEIFRKFSKTFAAQGEQMEMENKSFIRNVLIILFGHLWEVELASGYIFAFNFTLRSQQPDLVPIICHRCH